MTSAATTPDEYVDQLPDDRKPVISKLRKIVSDHLPNGFEETMIYGSIGYVVPKTKYPKGYHCDTKLPLPFINIASQKNFVALYHMGIYSDPELMDWFLREYPKHSSAKLDMGKSCIRFKKPENIPFELIGQLVSKMNPDSWISVYESLYVKK